MQNKFLFFSLITMILVSLKTCFSTELNNFEKLPTKGPFYIICGFLDLNSFKNFNLVSKNIHQKILTLSEIGKNQNEEEVDKLIYKFKIFLEKQVIGISVEEYFRIFSLKKMQEYSITLEDIFAYQKIQERKSIVKKTPLKFGRVSTYEKFNTKIYACFYDDFKKRYKAFNGGGMENRIRVLLQHEGIAFLSPCICEFKKVTDLYLFNNSLYFIPKEIGYCTTLKYIDLSNNPLMSFPPEIAKCILLKKIRLIENPNINKEEIKQIFKSNKNVTIEYIEPLYAYYESLN